MFKSANNRNAVNGSGVILKTLHDSPHAGPRPKKDVMQRSNELERRRLIYGAGPSAQQIQVKKVLRDQPQKKSRNRMLNMAKTPKNMQTMGFPIGARSVFSTTAGMLTGSIGQGGATATGGESLPIVHTGTLNQNATAVFPAGQPNGPSPPGSSGMEPYDNYRLVPVAQRQEQYRQRPLMTESSEISQSVQGAEIRTEPGLILHQIQLTKADPPKVQVKGHQAYVDVLAKQQKELQQLLSEHYQSTVNVDSPLGVNVNQSHISSSITSPLEGPADQQRAPALQGTSTGADPTASQGIKPQTQGKGLRLRLNIHQQQHGFNQPMQQELENDPVRVPRRPALATLNPMQSSRDGKVGKHVLNIQGPQLNQIHEQLEISLFGQINNNPVIHGYSGKRFHSAVYVDKGGQSPRHNGWATALSAYKPESSLDEGIDSMIFQSHQQQQTSRSKQRTTMTRFMDNVDQVNNVKRKWQHMYHPEYQHTRNSKLSTLCKTQHTPKKNRVKVDLQSELGEVRERKVFLAGPVSRRGALGVRGASFVATAEGQPRAHNLIDPLAIQIQKIKRHQLQQVSRSITTKDAATDAGTTQHSQRESRGVNNRTRNLRLSLLYQSQKGPAQHEFEDQTSKDVINLQTIPINGVVPGLGTGIQKSPRKKRGAPDGTTNPMMSKRSNQKKAILQLPVFRPCGKSRCTSNSGEYPSLNAFSSIKTTNPGNYLVLPPQDTADEKSNTSHLGQSQVLNDEYDAIRQKSKSVMTNVSIARHCPPDSNTNTKRRYSKLQEIGPPGPSKAQNTTVRRNSQPLVTAPSAMDSIDGEAEPQVKRIYIGGLTSDQFKMPSKRLVSGQRIHLSDIQGTNADATSQKSKPQLTNLQRKKGRRAEEKKGPPSEASAKGWDTNVEFKEILRGIETTGPGAIPEVEAEEPPKSLSKLTDNLNDEANRMEEQRVGNLGKFSQEKMFKLKLDLEKAKIIQQEIMSTTVNEVAHVMGKMSSYSANRQIQCYKPGIIFSKANGFQVKPLEARYLSIPLRTETAPGEAPEQAEAPMIIYIAKFTPVLDDAWRAGNQRKIVVPDLQVFVSRQVAFPNLDQHDFQFDFSTVNNSLQIAKIEIQPASRGSSFANKEEFINLGLFSLDGLPEIALIYGFSNRVQFSLKSQLIAAFNKHPNQAEAGSLSHINELASPVAPPLAAEKVSSPKGEPARRPGLAEINEALETPRGADGQIGTARSNTIRSAVKEFKASTSRIIEKRVGSPRSIDTASFLENWHQLVEDKKIREIREQRERRGEAGASTNDWRSRGASSGRRHLPVRLKTRHCSPDTFMRVSHVLKMKDLIDWENHQLRTFQAHRTAILKNVRESQTKLVLDKKKEKRIVYRLITQIVWATGFANLRHRFEVARQGRVAGLWRMVLSKRLIARQRQYMKRLGRTVDMRLEREIQQAFNLAAVAMHVGLANSRTLTDLCKKDKNQACKDYYRLTGDIRTADKCANIVHQFLWNYNRRIYQFRVSCWLFRNRISQIQLQYREKYRSKLEMKYAIVQGLMGYKPKMIEYFVFSKKTKNRNKYDEVQKQIIGDIDWPLKEDADANNIDKSGRLWRAVCDWVDLHNINFQVNFFRWQDQFSDIGRIEPKFLERLLKRYQAVLGYYDSVYDPAKLKKFPKLDIPTVKRKATGTSADDVEELTFAERRLRARQTDEEQDRAAAFKGKRLATKMAGAISKMKLRNKRTEDQAKGKIPMVELISRDLQDQYTCRMLREMGVEPQVLDSLCPPEAALDYEAMNYQDIIYKILVAAPEEPMLDSEIKL